MKADLKMTKLSKVVCLTLAGLALAAPAAHAEFFNDVRRTFQTDMPHFFQDDIPCAFGGQPTSHTKSSCRSNGSVAPGRLQDSARMPLRGEPIVDPRTAPVQAPAPAPRPLQY